MKWLAFALSAVCLISSQPGACDLTHMGDIALLMAYDEMGQECEQGGNLDRALFWYTLGMKTHPSFYECRFVLFNPKARKDLEEKLKARRLPPERGKPWSKETTPPGSVVYVYAEEGFGDTIQFCRYVERLVVDGYQVIFRPQPELDWLMQKSFGDRVTVDTVAPEEELPFDAHVPLLSLSHHYITKVDEIPGRSGYLQSDPHLTETYRDCFFESTKLKVGLVWQGCPDRFNDQQRSLLLKDLLPLLEVPGVEFYALQKGFGAEQLNDLPPNVTIFDVGSTFQSFADTAAALANLDLLISVDTSVAHLGGAMGKPTWILLPGLPDWRWFRKGDVSFWYDSVLLFRQEIQGSWVDPVSRMKRKLEELASTHGDPRDAS